MFLLRSEIPRVLTRARFIVRRTFSLSGACAGGERELSLGVLNSVPVREAQHRGVPVVVCGQWASPTSALWPSRTDRRRRRVGRHWFRAHACRTPRWPRRTCGPAAEDVAPARLVPRGWFSARCPRLIVPYRRIRCSPLSCLMRVEVERVILDCDGKSILEFLRDPPSHL